MIKLYHSQQAIWWNTGNEIKPNQAALNKIQFEEATNFNVSWISETEINVIVPTNQTTTLIKIVDDNSTPTDKYFYLVEVLNRTTENHECIYELDVWLTYLLPDLKRRQSIRTIRTLDVNTLKPTINIEPVGVPTGDIEVENYGFTPNIEEGLIRVNNTAETKFTDQRPYSGLTTNIYYVFKSKPGAKNGILYDTQTYMGKLPNYVLVPLLNIHGYGIVKEYTVYDRRNGAPQKMRGDVLNSYNNIQALINNSSDFGNQGVGDFIGVWVGPNYFRLKEKGVKVYFYNAGDAWNILGNWAVFCTTDIPVDYRDNTKFYVENGTQSNRGTFLALRVDSMPLSMVPLSDSVDKTIFLKGLRYQENQDNHLILAANSIAFNESFNYTNGVETTTININVPVAYDSYYNMLNQQKHTLNTSLALSGVNSIVQGVGALTGLIPPTPTTLHSSETITKDHQPAAQKVGTLKTRITEKGKRGGMNHMGWKITNDFKMPPVQKLSQTRNYSRTIEGATGLREMSGAANGLISAGMQFASTLANQEAYRADLRTKMSAAVLNANDKYVSWYKIATKIAPISNVGGLDAQQFIRLLSYEILSGPETEPGISYTFYGVPSQPQIISDWETGEAYIQIDENTSLKLQNDWGSFYTPIIKEAMLTLLTNGIRISGGKIK